MTDTFDRLSRIARQRMRGKQAQLHTIQDRLTALDNRSADLARRRAQARETVHLDPRYGADLDRFEQAADREESHIARARATHETEYRDVEEAVYDDFAEMKTYETVGLRRAQRRRQAAERAEAERRDEIAVARRARRGRRNTKMR